MMDRRTMLGGLIGVTAAAPVGAEVEIIDAEPKPLLAVMSFPADFCPLSSDEAQRIMLKWEELYNGEPPCKLVILPPGVKLDVIVDPRPKEK